MSPEQRKRITYDLALEYAKQHHTFADVESNIPEMVNHFAEICEKFDNALKKIWQNTKFILVVHLQEYWQCHGIIHESVKGNSYTFLANV